MGCQNCGSCSPATTGGRWGPPTPCSAARTLPLPSVLLANRGLRLVCQSHRCCRIICLLVRLPSGLIASPIVCPIICPTVCVFQLSLPVRSSDQSAHPLCSFCPQVRLRRRGRRDGCHRCMPELKTPPHSQRCAALLSRAWKLSFGYVMMEPSPLWTISKGGGRQPRRNDACRA